MGVINRRDRSQVIADSTTRTRRRIDFARSISARFAIQGAMIMNLKRSPMRAIGYRHRHGPIVASVQVIANRTTIIGTFSLGRMSLIGYQGVISSGVKGAFSSGYETVNDLLLHSARWYRNARKT